MSALMYSDNKDIFKARLKTDIDATNKRIDLGFCLFTAKWLKLWSNRAKFKASVSPGALRWQNVKIMQFRFLNGGQTRQNNEDSDFPPHQSGNVFFEHIYNIVVPRRVFRST